MKMTRSHLSRCCHLTQPTLPGLMILECIVLSIHFLCFVLIASILCILCYDGRRTFKRKRICMCVCVLLGVALQMFYWVVILLIEHNSDTYKHWSYYIIIAHNMGDHLFLTGLIFVVSIWLCLVDLHYSLEINPVKEKLFIIISLTFQWVPAITIFIGYFIYPSNEKWYLADEVSLLFISNVVYISLHDCSTSILYYFLYKLAFVTYVIVCAILMIGFGTSLLRRLRNNQARFVTPLRKLTATLIFLSALAIAIIIEQALVIYAPEFSIRPITLYADRITSCIFEYVGIILLICTTATNEVRALGHMLFCCKRRGTAGEDSTASADESKRLLESYLVTPYHT
eukprot:TRINITY_DN9529_c0_g1_i1.p1 TRINITY_DN9529_c0_g1~~TRINITY_DN9529_c0_g1_i1.p1  ORF type:complete len:342 (+),score=26.00 TRINITY_DN9529_c0_g1_i1:92-1117(+)